MSEKVNNKVANATEQTQKVANVTDASAWAGSVFGYAWGVSTFKERLAALEKLVGNQTELIRASGLAPTTYKSALSRDGDMGSAKVGQLAKAGGVSLDYLIYGTPITARDGECEEKRFDLACEDFVKNGPATQREDRRLQLVQVRLAVESQIAQLTDRVFAERFQIASFVPAPPGYHTVPALDGDSSGGTGPLALSFTWLDEHGIKPGALRYLVVRSGEGGAQFSAGTIVLIDCANVVPVVGPLLAMGFGDDVQLRRVVRRLSGTIELVHLNPAWPSEEVANVADAPVLGTVVFALSPA